MMYCFKKSILMTTNQNVFSLGNGQWQNSRWYFLITGAIFFIIGFLMGRKALHDHRYIVLAADTLIVLAGMMYIAAACIFKNRTTATFIVKVAVIIMFISILTNVADFFF
jgi:cation transport ATPase